MVAVPLTVPLTPIVNQSPFTKYPMPVFEVTAGGVNSKSSSPHVRVVPLLSVTVKSQFPCGSSCLAEVVVAPGVEDLLLLPQAVNSAETASVNASTAMLISFFILLLLLCRPSFLGTLVFRPKQDASGTSVRLGDHVNFGLAVTESECRQDSEAVLYAEPVLVHVFFAEVTRIESEMLEQISHSVISRGPESVQRGRCGDQMTEGKERCHRVTLMSS